MVSAFFSLLGPVLQKRSRLMCGDHAHRHYSKCGTSSMLQRVVLFPKPRSYTTCNSPGLNYISFVSCRFITLQIHLKFMSFAAKSTFPLYTYRSVSPPPQSTCTPLHLLLLNSLWTVHSTYGWRTSPSDISPYKRNPPFHLDILTSLYHMKLFPNWGGNKWTQ